MAIKEITLKAARINAEKTLKEVSRVTQKSENTLRSYENYRTRPDIDTSLQLAELYGRTVDEIIWAK